MNNTENLYSKLCAGCHGADGEPDSRALNLFNPAPQSFGERLSGDTISADSLRETIRNGSNGMPGFSGRLTDPQIAELAEYVRKLSAQRKANR